MKSIVRRALTYLVVVSAITCAVGAPGAQPALASGGADSGGNGAGGGGGSTPTTLVPCAQISSFKATGGNYHAYGAIWVGYTVKNCGPDGSLTVTVTETTSVDPTYSWGWPVSTGFLETGGSYSVGNLDNDFALPGTTYHLVIAVTDRRTGSLLATQSIDATTGIKVGP